MLPAFTAKQCVEKYLKARLLEAGIGFPRPHDLPQLLNACLPVEPLWSAYSKAVDGMTDYAVDFRYLMATLRAGLRLEHISERAVDAGLATRSPRSAKYLDWPLLLLLRFRGTIPS